MSKKTVLIILLTLLVVPIIVLMVFAYAFNFDVSFTSTSGSCSLSGTYTKKIYADGSYEWSPSRPSSATLSVSGSAEGLGHAYVSLVSGHVNGTPADDGKDGNFIGMRGQVIKLPIIPTWREGTGSWSVSDDFSGLPLSEGTYNWKVKGKFEKKGCYFDGWNWKDKDITYSSNTFEGSWTIVHENVASTLCKRSGCNEVVTKPDEHYVFCDLYLYREHTANYPTGRYWSCKESEANLHKARTCVRCGDTFHNCMPQQCRNYPSRYCGETY